MATYNGGAFINKQLDSIVQQTHLNWQLWIRDDGSSDDTLDIIDQYRQKYANIRLFTNLSGVRGACANFSALFELAQADATLKYLMFCDQDDIWNTEKISKSLAALQEIEGAPLSKPALVYGDLTLINEQDGFIPGNLKLIAKIRLRNLISYNYALGCTMMLNRPLADEIGTIPRNAENHDYWVALVASIYQSRFLKEKLINYRQHRQNVSGNIAGNNSFLSRIKRHVISPQKEIGMLRRRFLTLSDFFSHYEKKMTAHDREILKDYLDAYGKGRVHVCYAILKNGIFRNGFFQSVALIYHLLFFFNSIQSKPAV